MSGARAAVDKATNEAQWQRIVEECAAAHGWLYFHDADSRRNNAGYPDLTCVHPQRGVTLFCELKTERGRLRPEQIIWRDALILSGARWYLWRPSDWQEVEAVLKGGG
jgi:hypothetical protein